MRELSRQPWTLARLYRLVASERFDGVVDVFGMLVLTLAASVLALGTQHLPVLVGVSAAMVATTVVAVRRGECRLTIVALVLFGLGAWSALQACPLPLPILRVLSPKSADIWIRAYFLTDTGRHTASISLDPGASLVEALKWTTYGAAAVVGDFLARRIGVHRIAALPLCLAAMVASVTLAHGLLHARKLYGFYVPSFDPGPWGFGPLLNGNNRAGYLNLGAFSGFALLISRRYTGPRWPVAFAVGLVLAVSVLARSRGGLGALFVGSAIIVFMLLRRAMTGRRSQRRFYLRAAIAPVLALVGGMSLAATGGDGQMWARMRKENLEKLHIVSWTRQMLADFPVFGIGRGSFESVFPAYRMNGDHLVYGHAENFLTDWATGWGMAFAIPAFIALGWAIRPQRGDESAKTVLRLAIGVLLLQNLVDHALETPAIAMLVAVILAALASDQARAPRLAPRFSPLVLSSVALSMAITALLWGRHPNASDRAMLATRVRGLDPTEPQEYPEALGEIQAAIVRHPADPFLPLLAATTSRRVPNSKPLRWLGWALERDPMSGQNHLTAAYFLQRGGAGGQALRELRIAAENDPGARRRAALWAASFARNPRDAFEVVIDGAEGAPMLMVLAAHRRFASQRFALLEEASARDPSLLDAHTLAASAYISALERADDPSCHWANLPACIQAAQRHIFALERLSPNTSGATELAARLMNATGRGADARALLSERCSSFRLAGNCWRQRIELSRGEVAGPEYTRALRAFYGATCTNSGSCIGAARYVAGALRARSDNLGALEYFGKAVDAGDNSASTWMAIAATARSAGQPHRATEALKKAQRAAKGDTDMEARIETALQAVLPADLKAPP